MDHLAGPSAASNSLALVTVRHHGSTAHAAATPSLLATAAAPPQQSTGLSNAVPGDDCGRPAVDNEGNPSISSDDDAYDDMPPADRSNQTM